MTVEWTTAAPAKDRRVRRTRAALMRAAVDLVTERGSAAVAVSEIAAAADVSRQVLYQQFGDRDTLLLAAASSLVQRELLEPMAGTSPMTDARALTLAMARHFARHRRYYRALLTGSCAYALNRALTSLFVSLNRQFVQRVSGTRTDPQTVEDVAAFITGGAAVVVNTWVVDGPEPLDPEAFTDRLMRMRAVMTAAMTEDGE
jgi:AcrR family transcriptional regulator